MQVFEMRFLPSISANGAKQMAIDEAILLARGEGLVPDSLRFYSWKPPCVSIGYFQSAKLEVDSEKARQQGVDIVRRYTGGGAVFHDSELTYSIVISEQRLPKDIIESYKHICGFVVRALKKLRLPAKFAPINDIIVNSRKISGNAQTRRNGIVLQHGTVLLNVDINKMFSLLRVPDEKQKHKLVLGVTSVSQELGRELEFEELASAMRASAIEHFKLRLKESPLTEAEVRKANELKSSKYGNKGWTFCR